MTDPSVVEVLLVGPRVAHMKPHFEQRGYTCDAFQTGGEAMLALMAKARDVVILECQLGDQTADEFVERAKASEPHAAYLLLDDISRAGQIAKAMQRGIHRYLPTPPNEALLFSEVASLVTAARAMSGRLGETHALEVRKLKAELERTRTDATEADLKAGALLEEAEALRDEAAQLRRRPAPEDLEVMRDERDDFSREAESLRRRVEELTASQIEQEGKLSEFGSLEKRADELQDVEKRATDLDERVFELATELEDKDAELLKTRAELEGLTNSHAATMAEHESLKTRAVELERELEVRAGQVAELETQRGSLEEKAIALEFQVDEAEAKVAFIEEQVNDAEQRAVEAEAKMKSERLRLIDEKQDAAAGSHEAYQKMEKMLGELKAARTAKTEAEAQVAALREKLGENA